MYPTTIGDLRRKIWKRDHLQVRCRYPDHLMLPKVIEFDMQTPASSELTVNEYLEHFVQPFLDLISTDVSVN